VRKGYVERFEDFLFLGGVPSGDEPFGDDVAMMCRGCVAVSMDEPRHAYGSLALPADVAAKYRPDTATVIGRSHHVELPLGARVVVHPYDGKWISGFWNRSYRAKGQVRMYGAVGERFEEAKAVEWDESICGLLLPKFKPLGRHILILRPEEEAREGDIYLPDMEHFRQPMGVVVAKGARCQRDEIQVGNRVIMLNGAMRRFKYTETDPEIGLTERHALIHEEAILCVLT